MTPLVVMDYEVVPETPPASDSLLFDYQSPSELIPKPATYSHDAQLVDNPSHEDRANREDLDMLASSSEAEIPNDKVKHASFDLDGLFPLLSMPLSVHDAD